MIPVPAASPSRPSVRLTPFAAPAMTRKSRDRKSTRLNSSHLVISYAVFCLKKKKNSHLSVMLPQSPDLLIPFQPPSAALSLDHVYDLSSLDAETLHPVLRTSSVYRLSYCAY